MAGLAGKAAVVTGGSRGIGRAIVERLARDGATVVFSFVRAEQAAADVCAAVAAAGGRAEAVRADQGSLSDVRHLFQEAQRRMGGLDILVVNAGIGVGSPIVDVREEDLDRVFAVNFKGTLFAMQEAARRMRHGGRVINISTVNTVLPVPGVGVYSATKAAVEQLTRVGALELGARQITVNTVSPGATDTELFHQSNPPGAADSVAGLTPLGRIGQPADVADVVAFLVGPDARWLTGQHLRASGGLDVGPAQSDG
jgi:3-oxoacyl-[acyl-carrier protein] reductase